MVKIYFFLVFFLCLHVGNIDCQFNIGLKFGYNISQIDFGKNKPSELPSSPNTFRDLHFLHFGLTSNLPIKNRFDLGFDIFYIGKGFNRRPVSSALNLRNTLAFPVYIKYNLFDKFYLQGGLELDYTFSTFLISGFEITNLNQFTDQTQFLGLGPFLGIQYAFAKKWRLDFRFVRVLSENPDDLEKIFTRTFMFSVNRKFGKK